MILPLIHIVNSYKMCNIVFQSSFQLVFLTHRSTDDGEWTDESLRWPRIHDFQIEWNEEAKKNNIFHSEQRKQSISMLLVRLTLVHYNLLNFFIGIVIVVIILFR